MSFLKFRHVLGVAVRLLVILTTDYLNDNYGIPYTDIDYHVFTDGANEVLKGNSPYERETYRYTPILAYIMIPNVKLTWNFGKYLFSIADVLVGVILEILIKEIKFTNSLSFVSYLYLFNPITINICTRGSADCLITLFVLLTVFLLRKGRFFSASICYGVSLHLKIYPIIYIIALFLFIVTWESKVEENKDDVTKHNFVVRGVYYVYSVFLIGIKGVFSSFKAMTFVLLSLAIWAGLFALFYNLYGYKFAYEYLLYHVVRKDHRHNYSLYFYIIYLTFDKAYSSFISLISFWPQALLIFFTSISFYSNIEFCILIQTMIFVAFNKVITAQYFIWYISLLPLVANQNLLFTKKKTKGCILFIIWLFFELLWNYFSHCLENQGKNTFKEMNIVNIAFFLINCTVITELIKNQDHLVMKRLKEKES